MKQIWKKILLGLLILILALTGAFFVYVSDYYRADASAKALLETADITEKDRYLIVESDVASDTALIFYPGGKVEYLAYLPLLDQITERTGITCFLVEMPFNLAVFDSNAADRIMAQHPMIQNWYVGGYSLGGAMASQYASSNPQKIKGLILMGAYLYGNYPASKTLTVYGTLNTEVADKINYTEHVIAIEGGNHAQFGNYGKQKGDLDAAISAESQQNQTVEAIRLFLSSQQ
ncbi:alpha/beta fold hydrolase [Proteiniclasticum sp. QWL-01]|uniref:alpha/beta fold hydrolase n=1 Tax=Proteiniclasticum sp. QWL-01 TaxID=3036945 RepID=UPI00240F3E78|nr:alpha/beta fold hydrolase [Proteiniclasticum sp. QWL-01]WFF72227.1 alpha/beta fold hydrolase [Proteiniclasticum sp. QWL-01]